MRVIVVGCGRVGSELAVRLQREGHAVAVIDKNANAFRRLPDDWPGETIVGFGFDRDDLLQAGIYEASAVAAVTSGDNTNILTARIARETFEIPYVVARIYDPRRAVIYQRLGIPTVATVSWTVDQVVRRLLPEEAVTAWTDPTGEINMVEHPLPESYCGHSYGELTDGDRFRPVLVTRGGQARLVGTNLVGQEGDLVHFAVRTDAVGDLDRRLAGAGAPARSDRGGGGRRGSGGADSPAGGAEGAGDSGAGGGGEGEHRGGGLFGGGRDRKAERKAGAGTEAGGGGRSS
jgi:trk system potassium uptake protein TrkA